MSEKVVFINTVEQLADKINILDGYSILGLDVETLGLNPINYALRTIQISNSDKTLVVDALTIGYEKTAYYLKPYLENTEIVKILHNAKFDLKFIKHYLKCDVERIYDSYIASIIMEGGIRREKGYHSLAGNVKRFLNEELKKEEQASDWSGELTPSQIEYAAKDAEILFPLREKQINKLRRMGLVRCAKLEFECVLPTAWLELCGFYLDINQWNNLSETNSKRAAELSKEILDELYKVVPEQELPKKGGININSTQQIQKYFAMTGIPMPNSTREPLLQPLADKYPLIAKLLEYKKLAKRVSTYGPSWEEWINKNTGRVHADFLQLGAEDTGRYSSASPNLQNIPKENEFRNCFKVAPGNVLISGDYSQIELRILADLARDKSAMEQFAAGKDFHQATADLINRSRNLAKNCNFAIPYGAGPVRVASTAKISQREAENLMREYFLAFPNFEKWIKKQKRDVLGRSYARTASGRVMRYIFDPADHVARGQAQRNATNGPIQGTSADILKRALRLVYDKFKDRQDKVKLVNIVHDEINMEAPAEMAEEVQRDLNECMEKAAYEFLKEVVVKVDVKTSQYWHKD